MRMVLIATLMIIGVSFAVTDDASAAAASGASIATALSQSNATRAEPVACRRVRVCRKGYGCVWRRTCW